MKWSTMKIAVPIVFSGITLRDLWDYYQTVPADLLEWELADHSRFMREKRERVQFLSLITEDDE
jgi:hypothetical protein